MRIVYLNSDSPYIIGKQGETNAVTLRVDVTEWVTDFPNGTGVILFTRPNKVVYPLETSTITLDSKTYLQTIITTKENNVPGWVVLQAQWYNGETLVKSMMFSGKVLVSGNTPVDPTETVPDWVTQWMTTLREAIDGAGNLIEAAEIINDDYENILQSVSNAEAWAKGTRGGEAVESTDETYHNNSKYYSEQIAATYEDVEAWANGTRGGVDIGSDDPAYQKNGKYYNTQAAASASAAAASASEAMTDTPEGYANVVASISPTYDGTKAYAVGAYCLNGGKLYRCTTAITEAEATFNSAHWTQVNVGSEVADLKSAYYAIGTEQDYSYLSAYRDGYYIKIDGETEEANNMLSHTDYILIPPNAESVTCGNRTSNSTGSTTYRVSPNILFYDDSKTLIEYNAADASITKPTYNIPAGAKYCIINQPSAIAKAAAGVALIKFNPAEIENGFVGTYSGAFSAASQQIQTGIQLNAGVLYSIVVNTAITARINIFPHADSNKMIRVFAPGSYPLCVASDTTLDLYNGTYGYTGSISVNVVRQGYIDDAMTKVPMVYEVGGKSPLQSFTALLLALKNDDREKIIYINGGDYDIFQEYTDLGLLSGDPPVDPTNGYFDKCVWVPKNTHIIGRGIVRLLWQPTTSDISAAWSKTISVINAAGTMTLENVEIYVKNGRYCIHDDPLGKGAYTGARKIYKNVKCYKFLNDEGYGFNPVIGCGIDREMYYEFDNCLFKSEANQNAFYMHNRAGTEDMPSLTKSLSSNVVVKDCIMITTGRGVALGNVSNSSAQRIRADFYNCYISGTFNVGDESAYTSGNNSNVFDITLNQCTAPTISIADPNNTYPANVYN